MTLARSKMSILVYVIALLTIIAGILAAIELRGATPHAHAAKAEASVRYAILSRAGQHLHTR